MQRQRKTCRTGRLLWCSAKAKAKAEGESTDGQTATTTPATVAAARLTMVNEQDRECRANWRALQQQ